MFFFLLNTAYFHLSMPLKLLQIKESDKKNHSFVELLTADVHTNATTCDEGR